jgi:serine/threonine protein kinase
MDIPQIIAGRFRVECEIGRGGMGTVYRATHLGLDRPVAVKVLKKEIASDPEVAERFMREARTMAKLRHPRAAMIFDAGRLADGRPFIIMEHAEGRTLADTLQTEGPFAPARAVRVAAEICEVLAEAHALGIVHRDLKPSNIMLTDRGVCVLDFGIAKVLAGGPDATRTHPTTESGLVIGTPRYMSPEQCLGQKVGPASDLYSVGVLVYEMLAGRPPFVDQLASAVLVKQATQAPAPLVALRPDAPRALAVAVHTLLGKNPVNRPRTATDARKLLEKSIVAPPAEPAPEVTPFASTIDVLNTGRSLFLRVATGSAILAMLGAVLVVWSNRTVGGTTAAQPLLPARTPAEKSAASTSPSSKTPALREGARAVASKAEAADASALTHEAAYRLASAVSRHGAVSDARVIRTRGGQAVAAIHDESGRGRTHLFLMESRGEKYAVTGRATLDTADFRGARWTEETLDADGDGYDEVLCAGASVKTRERRYVLYVPRTGETYVLSSEAGAKGGPQLRWSSNATTDAAQPFRAALKRAAASVSNRTL